MSVTVEQFVEPVVANVIGLLRMMAGSHLKTDDDRVELCAIEAYEIICEFCNRRFHLDTYEEIYKVMDGYIEMRNIPIVQINSIKRGTTLSTDVETDEYYVLGDRIKFTGLTNVAFLTGEDVDESRPFDVLVNYDAGTTVATGKLLSALERQALGLYHQIPTEGVAQINTGDRNIIRASFKVGEGKLMENAVQTASSLVYTGDGRSYSGYD